MASTKRSHDGTNRAFLKSPHLTSATLKKLIIIPALWVKHLWDGEPDLEDLLEDGHVLCHPFILGKLACGNLKKRTEILGLLQALKPSRWLFLRNMAKSFISQKTID